MKDADKDTGHAVYSSKSTEPVDHVVETEFNSSAFTPEVEMVSSNPLYESSGLSADSGASQAAANPLYESTSLTGLGSACVITNPLCDSTCTPRVVDAAPAIANPLYEATSVMEGTTGEVNYGGNVDEDGSAENRLV